MPESFQKSPSPTPTPPLVIAALVAVQVFFGISYVVSKIIVDALPPLVWASLRLLTSASALLLVARFSGRPHPPRTREYFVGLVPLALLGMVLNQGLFILGLHYTTASNSAILNTLIPVFTLALVTIRGQERLTWRKASGFAVAFLGVLALRRAEHFDLSDKTLLGNLFTVLNCISYAAFITYGKRFMERHDRLWTTAWLFAYGAVAMTLIALPQWLSFQPPHLSPELTTRLWACMATAVIVGTIFTYFLNLWALAQVRSSSVAFFVYLQPVVTCLLSWAWLGQAPEAREGVAFLLICAGFALTLQRRSARRSSASFRSANAS